MKARLTGFGAWGPGFGTAQALWALLDDPARTIDVPDEGERPARPTAAIIPPRERRRAPLSVKLAVEAAAQACEDAGVRPEDAACVFASALGDLDITDYMCRTLAGESPQLSPTKFHNSVHNAPVGYWSISTGDHHAGNAVAGGPMGTIAVSLLEAAIQCDVEQRPVLWVSQDIAAPPAYRALWPVRQSCAFAIMLEPGSAGASTRFELLDTASGWPALDSVALAALYQDNPSARSLALLQAWRRGQPVALPLNDHRALRITPP